MTEPKFTFLSWLPMLPQSSALRLAPLAQGDFLQSELTKEIHFLTEG